MVFILKTLSLVTNIDNSILRMEKNMVFLTNIILMEILNGHVHLKMVFQMEPIKHFMKMEFNQQFVNGKMGSLLGKIYIMILMVK